MGEYVEVDGQKFVDDGTGNPKVDESGQRVPFVESSVPYHRFKEVNDKLKTVGDEIAELKKAQKGPDGLTDQQKKELEAKTYLKGLLGETLEEQKKAEAQAEAQELKTFQQEVDDTLGLNPSIKKDEFLKFLEEEGDDYSSVTSAMKGYKKLEEAKTQGAEKAKKDLKGKPNLPAGEGGGAKERPAEDKNKSLWQIAEEAISQSKK